MLKNPRRPFILIACAGTVFWPGAFIFGFPGVMSEHWRMAFSVNDSEVGRTIFFILIGATCFMYLCGRWQEKFGPGKLVAFGSLLCGSSVIWLGRIESMTSVYVWGFLVGVASAFTYVPALTVVQRWFLEKRGLVSGFLNMAFGLSAAILSPVVPPLLLHLGYEAINLILGFLALCVGLTSSIFIRFPEVPVASATKDMAIEPDGRSAFEALKNRAFWCLWLTWALAGAAGASMLVLATKFGLANGLGLSKAVVILTGFNLTNGCGRLISGFLSDRFGRSRTMAFSFICAAIAYLSMTHLGGIWLWTILAAVIGFAFGTLFAVTAPLVGDCFGLTNFGAIFGLIFTAYGLFSGPLGPWLSGYILDVTNSNYTLVFSYLGLMYLISAGLISLVRPRQDCRL